MYFIENFKIIFQVSGEEQNEQVENPHENAENNEHYEQEGGEEKVPLLFVDVNLGEGEPERIVIHEGDDPQVLADKFVDEHGSHVNSFFNS